LKVNNMVSKQEGSTKLTSDTEPLQQLTNAIREREESKACFRVC